ncbi:MAG: 1,2-phenylacetyl-CoA epoxidase subunit PaaE [Gammaproteobacteria bacterium]
MSVENFYPLQVAKLEPQTDAAVCLTFAVPEKHQAEFVFLPGQYLTLRRKFDGVEVRRSYSICSGINDGQLRVAVKHIAGGIFSGFINQEVKAGDVLDVMPPQGNFYVEPKPDNDKNYLCIAAGSGITPVLSIIKSILEVETDSHVTLLFGNRQLSSIMFREELEALKNACMQRFQWLNILSREKQDVAILNGRIDNKKGAELCRHLLNLQVIDEFFLCGPEAMISEVSRGLRAEGIAESRIRYELFAASAADAEAVLAKHHARALQMAGRVAAVTVISDGREHAYELTADGENILDGALDHGVDLPFACKGGVCATCKAKLIAGEVDMDLSHGLEADEIKAGYILTCQAHPVSDKVVVDFDQ